MRQKHSNIDDYKNNKKFKKIVDKDLSNLDLIQSNRPIKKYDSFPSLPNSNNY